MFPECLVSVVEDREGCTTSDVDDAVRKTDQDFPSRSKIAGTGVYSRNGTIYLEVLVMWRGEVYVQVNKYEPTNYDVLQYERNSYRYRAIKFLAMSPKVDVDKDDGEVLWNYERRRSNRNSLYGANGERYKGDEPTTLVQGRRRL